MVDSRAMTGPGGVVLEDDAHLARFERWARVGRTLAREAYFLEFAREIRAVASMPIMVTGDIRRAPAAQEVLASGIEMVCIGTALAIDPNLLRDWQLGRSNAPQLPPITWNNKVLASLANMAVVKYQLRKLSQGRDSQPGVSPIWAMLTQQVKDIFRTRQYRRWMAQRTAR